MPRRLSRRRQRKRRRPQRPACHQRRVTRWSIRRPRHPPHRMQPAHPAHPSHPSHPAHRQPVLPVLSGPFRPWAANPVARERLAFPQIKTPRDLNRGAALACARRVARVRGGYCFFIMSKNSALFFVARILSRMNSIDSISSMSWMNLRNTHTFCSRSGRISSSSRRVPDLFRLIAG